MVVAVIPYQIAHSLITNIRIGKINYKTSSFIFMFFLFSQPQIVIQQRWL